LSVDILQSTFRLLCLALELGFHVAGCASESLFHLAAKVLGVAGPGDLRSWAYSFCVSQLQRPGRASVPRAAAEMAADDFGLGSSGRSLTPLALAFGQPDECDQEDEAGGEHAEYHGKERQTKRPELRPVLACACSSRYRRQPPIQRFLPPASAPRWPRAESQAPASAPTSCRAASSETCRSQRPRCRGPR